MKQWGITIIGSIVMGGDMKLPIIFSLLLAYNTSAMVIPALYVKGFIGVRSVYYKDRQWSIVSKDGDQIPIFTDFVDSDLINIDHISLSRMIAMGSFIELSMDAYGNYRIKLHEFISGRTK
jgi:hypothetical protein